MFFPVFAFQFIHVLHYKICNIWKQMLLEKELINMTKDLIVTFMSVTEKKYIYASVYYPKTYHNYRDLDLVLEARALQLINGVFHRLQRHRLRKQIRDPDVESRHKICLQIPKTSVCGCVGKKKHHTTIFREFGMSHVQEYRVCIIKNTTTLFRGGKFGTEAA